MNKGKKEREMERKEGGRKGKRKEGDRRRSQMKCRFSLTKRNVKGRENKEKKK